LSDVSENSDEASDESEIRSVDNQEEDDEELNVE